MGAGCIPCTSSERVKGCLICFRTRQSPRMDPRRLKTVGATGSSGQLIAWASQTASMSRHRPEWELRLATKVQGCQTLLPLTRSRSKERLELMTSYISQGCTGRSTSRQREQIKASTQQGTKLRSIGGFSQDLASHGSLRSANRLVNSRQTKGVTAIT